MSQPNPTALQTALGTASVLGGIYGNVRGDTRSQQVNPYQNNPMTNWLGHGARQPGLG